MSDYKNQAWGLKLEKSSVRTISLCPLLGDHLFHLEHLPVVLLIHHHLNDNHHLPNGPTKYTVANMTIFNSNLPYWHHQLVLSWYHHQPESHQQSLNKGLVCT